MAIERHLPVCQLYRWQLGPNMWSLPTNKSLDSIVVTALGWASQGKPRTRHMWICLQLSRARGVDNGGIRAVSVVAVSVIVVSVVAVSVVAVSVIVVSVVAVSVVAVSVVVVSRVF